VLGVRRSDEGGDDVNCEAIGCDAVHCVICGSVTDGSGLCDEHKYDDDVDELANAETTPARPANR
jgi:hypothetical protein